MDAFATWVKVCDWVMAIVTEGMMTDDFPDYDWRGCWEWGDHPVAAVRGALHSRGVQTPGSMVS